VSLRFCSPAKRNPQERSDTGMRDWESAVQRFIGNQDHSSEPVKCICIHESARLGGHGFRESVV
jgi:hypothetical protein